MAPSRCSTQLVGVLQCLQCAGSTGACRELGVDLTGAVAALAEIPPIDGRFQRVPFPAANLPTVIVDYAHTEDGLEKVLRTASEIAPGRVVAVFGCGGDRDRGKRPHMAAIAARWAQRIVVTSDNPRTEDPDAIIAEILTGFTPEDLPRVRSTRIVRRPSAWPFRMPTRRLVVLAGKGHETYQIFADHTIHFDDREEALRALAARQRSRFVVSHNPIEATTVRFPAA